MTSPPSGMRTVDSARPHSASRAVTLGWVRTALSSSHDQRGGINDTLQLWYTVSVLLLGSPSGSVSYIDVPFRHESNPPNISVLLFGGSE